MIIAEIGINHNGDLGIAKKLIDVAASAGCDYVKFQKRTPAVCVPDDQKNIQRETPWGSMTYLEYKYRMEFGGNDYDEIDAHCKSRGIKWSASVWDVASYQFLTSYNLDFIKVPSALITDEWLLRVLSKGPTPVMISTGMSDLEMVDRAVSILGDKLHSILHCISTYPAMAKELNLNVIPMMKERYKVPIGYSNHHPGIIYMPVAIALGAEIVEFHITLDRSMWGTDQSASIEPEGVFKVCKYINGVRESLGNREKRIYESELPIIKKLRR